jgi:hypothetical protein
MDKELPLIFLVDGQQVAYDLELAEVHEQTPSKGLLSQSLTESNVQTFITYSEGFALSLDGSRQRITKRVASRQYSIEPYGNNRDMTEVWRFTTEAEA